MSHPYIAGNAHNNAAPVARPEAPLQSLTRRGETMTGGMREIAAKLRNHANSVHGGGPEQAGGNAIRPARCGQLGALDDALDDMSDALADLSEQAVRNCTLAWGFPDPQGFG